MRGSTLIAIWTVLFLLILPSSASAQGEIIRWLGPEMGKAKPLFSVQSVLAPAREVSGQAKDWRSTDHRVLYQAPVLQGEAREWSVGARLRIREIETDAVLPATGERFPDTLWDMDIHSQYRQRFGSGWIGGVAAGVGSASDKPFNSADETRLWANLFTRIPDGGKNAWLLLLSYDSNREFLPDVPLPGVGYWYEPNDRFRAVVGIPFAFLEVKPLKDLSFEIAYFPVRTVHAGVTWRIAPPLKALAAFDWRSERYARADRREKDRRLFQDEKRLTAGLQWRIGKRLDLDIAAGYAFDRLIFEGEDYGDRHFNRIDIADGPFFSARAGVSF
jgi:hypothetical protein